MTPEREKSIEDAKAVTAMLSQSAGWAVMKDRLETARRDNADKLLSLPLAAPESEVRLLRVEGKCLQRVIGLAEEVIQEGALALEDERAEAEAAREEAEREKAEKESEGRFSRIVERLFSPAVK